MSQNENRRHNYLWNILLIIGLTGLVYWIVLRENHIDIIPTILGANLYWILVAVLLLIFMRILSAYNLKTLCRLTHKHYTLWQGFINEFVGNFFSGITPSATGGQIGQIYVFRKQGIPLSTAAGVLWMEFILSQSAQVISVLILLALKFTHFFFEYSQFFLIVLLGFILNSSVIVGMYLLVKFPKVYTWITTKGIAFAQKLHLIKNSENVKNQIDRTLKKFEEEVQTLKKNRHIIPKLLFVDFLKTFIYFLIPYFVALALHIEVQPNQILDIIALTAFVNVVNALIPFPGSSGGTEATFVLMFSTLFGRVNASSIMLVWRFLTYHLMLLIGGITFIIAKIQKRVIVEESENVE